MIVEKVKSFFEKFVGYAGMLGALLGAVLVFANDTFRENEMSVLLIGITLVVIFFIFNIIFNKTKRYNSAPDLISGIFLFSVFMFAFLAVFVRMMAFILLDVDILGKRALIAYISTVLMYILIYIAGRFLSNHKTGLIASFIYIFLCAFDILPVLSNLKNGETKTALAIEQSGSILILISFIVALFAVKSETSRNASILSVVSGVIMGACIPAQKNAVIAAVCMMIMFSLTRVSYKYTGKDNVQSLKYKSYRYVLFYLAGFVLTAAAVIVALNFFGMKSYIPEWTLYLKDFDGINNIFRHVDTNITSVWGGVYFARNRFITYVSLLLYIFSLIMCSVGCLSAVKTKNTKSVFAIVFSIALSAFAVVENGDISYISSAIPFVIIIAGYGLSNVINIAYVQNSEIAENKLIIPEEIIKKDSEEIEKKYNLPEGCASFSIVRDNSAVDNAETEDIDAEEFSEDVDSDVENEENPVHNVKSENVVTGETLDNMLDNLYGGTDNGRIFRDDDEEVEPKDSVVIFKK